MSTEELKPAFSIKYLTEDGREIGIDAPIEQVASVKVEIQIVDLVANLDLGTAILKGFMDERKEEFVRLVQVIRAKKKANSKVLIPGQSKAGLHILQ